jgi:hypothetical protein
VSVKRISLAALLVVAVAALGAPGMASAQTVERAEIEPNDSTAMPDLLPVLADTNIHGSLPAVAGGGDIDFFRVVVTGQTTRVRFETFVPDRPTCSSPPGTSADTLIRLWNAAGSQLASDDDSGVNLCSLLVRNLAPGTYFISVEEFLRDDSILGYTLEIDFQTPATLALTPAAASNTVGTSHTVTATVRDSDSQPLANIVVRYTVTGSVNTTGQCVTGGSGTCTFMYQGPPLPGADAIRAFADTNRDGDQDAGEPPGAASKVWVLPASTKFCEVKITQGGWIIAMNGDQASFGGNARVLADGTVSGQENYQDHGPAQPRHVQSIDVTAMTCSDDLTEGSIFGRATVDGAGSVFFRIDVTDLGEPGTSDTYGLTMSDGYVSGQQRLQGGNVQIHKN